MYTCTIGERSTVKGAQRLPFLAQGAYWPEVFSLEDSLTYQRRIGSKAQEFASCIWPSARPGICGRTDHQPRFSRVPHRTGRRLSPGYFSYKLTFAHSFVHFSLCVTAKR